MGAHLIVLISPDDGPKLHSSLIGEIFSPIPRAHRSKSLNWLSKDKVCETSLFLWDNGAAKAWNNEADMLEFVESHVVSQAREKHGIDAAIVPSDDRRKSLLVADMDSTIIEQECIDELAEYAGKRAEISAITERAMRGELDFEGALRERVAMLKGLPETVLENAFTSRITFTPGAKTLVCTMKKFGAKTALVSGGFTFFTSRVAAAVGFDSHQANELLVHNGALTGKVREPILGREAKLAALEKHAADAGLSLSQTMAVGDGANDLAMMTKSGLGVAFRAKPAVAAAAAARIDHGDLTALLYLQGIPQSDFVV